MSNKDVSTVHQAFFCPSPVAFRRVYGLESCSRTSEESNHHRQSVNDTRMPRYQLSHEDDVSTVPPSELDELLQVYDMKRNLVELHYEAAQWKHKAVWSRKYMEAKRGYGLLALVSL